MAIIVYSTNYIYALVLGHWKFIINRLAEYRIGKTQV